MNTLITGERIDTIWSSYNLPNRLINCTFDNYVPRHKSQEQAVARLKEYAIDGVNKINTGQGLFIHGPVGTGKSHLAVATLRDVLSNNIDSFAKTPSKWELDEWCNGIKAAFVSVVDLLATIKDSFDGSEIKKEKASDLVHKVRSYGLIILDDIGAEKPTEWVEEQLYALIDLRYRMQRATVFTTNCSMKQLEGQIGNRAVSRIIDMTDGVKVDGPDYRKRKLA